MGDVCSDVAAGAGDTRSHPSELQLTPRKAVPSVGRFVADVQLHGAPASSLKSYAPAPPAAGTFIMTSSPSLDTTMLCFANLKSLGSFFDRSRTGAAQGEFVFPRAGQKGALVGAVGGGSFGYPVSANDISSLPRGKSTVVLDSYLYLVHGLPANEAAISSVYLRLLGTVYDAVPKPSIPRVNWEQQAAKEASDLLDPANLVTVGGKQYLRSYVSDTRTSPELITEAAVLAGVKAYEARFHVSLPLDALLDDGQHFYACGQIRANAADAAACCPGGSNPPSRTLPAEASLAHSWDPRRSRARFGATRLPPAMPQPAAMQLA